MSKFIPTRFFLPDDIVQVIAGFLWAHVHLRASEMAEDIDFYLMWRKAVPPIFMTCAILDTSQLCYVANPMRDCHPYWPRKLLDLTPKNVWGGSLYAFGAMICKERIREVRTYKRCCLRWIRDCTENLEIWYWFDLQQKLLSKIRIEHFRQRGHRGFLQEALQQVAFYTLSFSSA
jgi:hypothetical protein